MNNILDIIMEQYTRTKINTELANLGWVLSGTNKNVFQEEPRTSDEKRKLGRLRPIMSYTHQTPIDTSHLPL